MCDQGSLFKAFTLVRENHKNMIFFGISDKDARWKLLLPRVPCGNQVLQKPSPLGMQLFKTSRQLHIFK